MGETGAIMKDITPRIAAELVAHEAIVPECYKDSVGIWTWGVGVTDASGHKVSRYRDNPSSIARCLEIYVWLLRTRYLPPVLKAFEGFDMTEEQLGTALSFHYNTGAIYRASWVKFFRAGDMVAARAAFMKWTKPASLTKRRKAEAALLFDGVWSKTNGTALVYDVAKPSYKPVRPKRVPIMDDINKAMGVK